MQIHYPSHYDKVVSMEALFDPEINLMVAYRIWKDQGWRPWDCKL